MNYHSDEWIMNGVREHYEEAKQYFDESRIVGIFYQGSANYGLDYGGSDIDTKLIVVPTFEEITFNKKPVSTTHILDNNEHLDAKDVRLYINCFKKQNLNFVEILFTDYYIINPNYQDLWQELLNHKEEIARYNEYRAVKSMKGIAMEKYHALTALYPCQKEEVEQFGYASKQLHHLIRIEDFLVKYMAGKPYIECMKSNEATNDWLKRIKVNKGLYNPIEAQKLADNSIDRIAVLANQFCETHSDAPNTGIGRLLDDIQYEIIKRALKEEINR